jgi:hypothetical protein
MSDGHIHHSGIICTMGKPVPLIFFVSRSHKNQLPGNICTWRLPGKLMRQIWIILDNDTGFTLWPNAFCSELRIADYPSSGGFGYAIPTRGKGGRGRAGTLGQLRKFEYHVCGFICLFNPCSVVPALYEGKGHPSIHKTISFRLLSPRLYSSSLNLSE